MIIQTKQGGVLIIETFVVDDITVFIGDAFDESIKKHTAYVGIKELCPT